MEQIDIKSLRIGNYLSFGLLYIVKVTAINPQQFIVEAKNSLSGKDEIHDMISFKGDTASGNSRIEAFMPITLTEEILLKCGFIKIEEEIYQYDDEMTPVYRLGFFSIVFINNEFRLWIAIEDDPFYSFSWTKIQYIHQLQNLYFALIGKELEINL